MDALPTETATTKKKIFIKFNSTTKFDRTDWLHAFLGKVTEQNFQYFVGYEVYSKQFISLSAHLNGEVKEDGTQKAYFTKVRYSPIGTSSHKDTNFQEGAEMLPITEHNENPKYIESRYSIVDWTQEREDFCKKIQNAFIDLGDELKKFLTDITEEKFNALMTGNGLRLLSK